MGIRLQLSSQQSEEDDGASRFGQSTFATQSFPFFIRFGCLRISWEKNQNKIQATELVYHDLFDMMVPKIFQIHSSSSGHGLPKFLVCLQISAHLYNFGTYVPSFATSLSSWSSWWFQLSNNWINREEQTSFEGKIPPDKPIRRLSGGERCNSAQHT